MTNYKRGDIVLVLFPNSNLQRAKKRPALIVQADNLQTDLPQVIVTMVTSNIARANHKSRVNVLLNSPEGKTRFNYRTD
jgi:mRNA interferase MazF